MSCSHGTSTRRGPRRTIPIDRRLGRPARARPRRAPYVTDPGEGTVVTWDLDGSSSYLPLTSTLPALAQRRVRVRLAGW